MPAATERMAESIANLPSKNRDIEVLRAVAISYVLLAHWLPHLLRMLGIGDSALGFLGLTAGVDLFFCISGFVIASSALAELESGPSVSIAQYAGPFWIRRIFRLWPSAWFWALVPLVLAFCWNRSGAFGSPRLATYDAIFAVLNFENIHYYFCLQTQSCGPLGVYWSLSLEEQFYWIFPLLIFAVSRRILIALLLAAAIVQIVLSRPNSFSSGSPSLLWLLRSDAICLGILLALFKTTRFYHLPPILRSQRSGRVTTAGLFVLLAIIGSPALHLSVATGVLAIVSTALVWIAGFNQDLILPRTPFDTVVLWIGSRSYSLYLVHSVAGRFGWELYWRLKHTPKLAGLASVSIGVVFTVVFAEMNFRLLEDPLRKLGRRLARDSSRKVDTSGPFTGSPAPAVPGPRAS
jgi:peptidoglycan/LPS O-acetylase OafA/YrhL